MFTVQRPLSGAGLDRVDAGLPVRLGAAAVRRHRRSTRSSSSADRGRSSAWRRTSRHIGVHDHGFNNVSTYGNLWRLAREGRIDGERLGAALLRAGAEGQRRGAGAPVDARWPTAGSSTRSTAPHSLFVDTIRSLRALALGHLLGQRADGGAGRSASACSSGWLQHARATAQLQRLLRQRARPLRRSRPHRAREPVQRRQRHLSRAEHAAGLLAVHHVDPRPGVGDARLRRTARVPRRRCPTRISSRAAAAPR